MLTNTFLPWTLMLSAAVFLYPLEYNDFVWTLFGKPTYRGMLAEGSMCEPIRLPICQTMPYNVTRLPNLLFHSTQLNAGLILDQFQPLIETGCGEIGNQTSSSLSSSGEFVTNSSHRKPSSLVFYLCSMFVPVCPRGFAASLRERRGSNGRRQSALTKSAVDTESELIPPCRELCERVKAGCDSVLQGHGLVWPAELDCSGLPRHETGVCISPDSIDNRGSRTKSQRSTNCKCVASNSSESIRKAYLSQKFNYAIHVTFLKTTTLKDGSKRHRVRLRQVLNRNSFPRSLVHSGQKTLANTQLFLWTPAKRSSGCDCQPPAIQQMVPGSDYLILGRVDSRFRRLQLDDISIIKRWNKKWTSLIEKWNHRLRTSRGQTRLKHRSADGGK